MRPLAVLTAIDASGALSVPAAPREDDPPTRSLYVELDCAAQPRTDGGPDSLLLRGLPGAEPFDAALDAWVGEFGRAAPPNEQPDESLRLFGLWGTLGRARLEEAAEVLSDGLWRYRVWLTPVPDEQLGLLP